MKQLILLNNKCQSIIDLKNVMIASFGRTDQLTKDDIKIKTYVPSHTIEGKKVRGDCIFCNASLNARTQHATKRIQYHVHNRKAFYPCDFEFK